jgi:hypothetical protein
MGAGHVLRTAQRLYAYDGHEQALELQMLRRPRRRELALIEHGQGGNGLSTLTAGRAILFTQVVLIEGGGRSTQLR